VRRDRASRLAGGAVVSARRCAHCGVSDRRTAAITISNEIS
jgi:hypothetical protein